MMVSELWKSDDPDLWCERVGAAEDRRQAPQDDKFEELDKWFYEELPCLIEDRRPQELHKEDLVKLVEWKLKRGKWRPNLLNYAKSLDEAEVRQKSAAAFEEARKISEMVEGSPDNDAKPIKDAMQHLTALKGVGPATASAILTAVCRWVPFMSDEAMAAILTGPKQYTMPRYLEFAYILRQKADKLFYARPANRERTLRRILGAQELERALWHEAVLQKGQGNSSNKRKS